MHNRPLPLLRRWYPWGRDNARVFPVEITPYDRGATITVFHERSGALTARSIDLSAWHISVSAGLAAELNHLDRVQATLDEEGDSSEWWGKARRKALVAFRAGQPLPEASLDVQLSACGYYRVKEGADLPDPWRHIDALTGGCCNGLLVMGDGSEVYEATVDLLAAETLSPELELIALTPRLDKEHWCYLCDASRALLDRLPSTQDFDAKVMAERQAWIATRRPVLIEAISTHVTLPADGQWGRIGLEGHYEEGAELHKHQMQVVAEWSDELSRLNDCPRLSVFVGTFNEDGTLANLVLKAPHWDTREQPVVHDLCVEDETSAPTMAP